MVLVHAVVWLLSLLILGAVALPLTAMLFNPYSGKGAGFAVALGLAVVAIVTLWIGQVVFGPFTVTIAVVTVFVLSVLALVYGADPDWERYREVAVVLTVAYLVAVVLRGLSPKIRVWAEGYLNFGLMRSLLRADRLPPQDMWFAGEPVQYYYGGHMLVAAWGELLATPGEYLPNLAVPMVFAALVAGAWELGGAIATRRDVPRRAGAILAAVLLGFGGNWYAPLRLIAWLIPNGPALVLWNGLGLKQRDFGHYYTSFDATHFAWFPTDVPIYSVLIGSAHAHVFSQPWMLLLLGLAFAYYRTPPGARWQRRVVLIAAIPIAGLIGFTNIWSGPTAAAVLGLAVVFAPATPGSLLPSRVRDKLGARRAILSEIVRYFSGILVAAVTFGGALVAVAPFVFNTPTTRPIAFFPDRAGWGYFVVAYGWLLAAFALYLGPRLRSRVGGARDKLLIIALTGIALLSTAIAVNFPAVALVGPIALTAWWLLRGSLSERNPAGEWANPLDRSGRPVGFETVLILAGAGLALIVEVAYVDDGAAFERFNTAYKTYSQIWLLWTVAAGPILASMVYGGATRVFSLLVDPFRRRQRLGDLLGDFDAASLRGGVAAVLILSATLYGGGALVEGVTSTDRPIDSPSLDATVFAATEYPDHYRAISYLEQQPGQPHIVEAVPQPWFIGSFYASPASSLTGLPTVVGWSHVIDYHSEAAFQERARHVMAIYEGDPATRAKYLRHYDVQFIVVGPMARQRYSVAAVHDDPGLVGRQFGRVTVYVVNHTKLVNSEATAEDTQTEGR